MPRLASLYRFVAPVLGLVLAPAAPAVPAQQPSTTRAARLTFVIGIVSVDTAGNPTSQPAQLNLPILSGSRLSTGDNGQAEVEFEDGSVIRLTPNTTLAFDNLSIDGSSDAATFSTGLNLVRGLAYAELRATPQYRYTVNAGCDVLSPVENSTVRIDFDDPPAIFSVLNGTARIELTGGQNRPGSQRELRAGESLRGAPGAPCSSGNYTLSTEIADNSWDAWNLERDRDAAAQGSSSTPVRDSYSGAQGYGWSDLDANGSWYDVPGQGPVWQPQVAIYDTFDPYANGAWIYSGNTYLFASNYSWGWTPYRCGTWSYFNGFGWGWMPAGGCGGYGWSFAGGGRPVNILYGPNGYRAPHVPLRPPGPVHPIVPGRFAQGPTDRDRERDRDSRRIAGVAVTPIEPARRESNWPNGLRPGTVPLRDYPVDRNTHQAITGRQGPAPDRVDSRTNWRSPNDVRPRTNEARPEINDGRTADGRTINDGRATTTYRTPPPQSTPAYRNAPGRESAPQNSAPASGERQRTYTPAPAVAAPVPDQRQRTYTPAPAPQQASPPPQQQQHASPPPPPPQQAPAHSAPTRSSESPARPNPN